MPRFVLIVPLAGAPTYAAAAAAERLAGAAAPAFRERLGAAELLAWPTASAPLVPLGRRGFAIGALFKDTEPVAALANDEADALAADGARGLIDGYWGNYVAILAGPRGLHALRSPCGELACYHLRHGALALLFSHPADILALPRYRPQLSRAAVATAVLDPRRLAGAAALADVDELAAGARLDLPSLRITPLWQAANRAQVRAAPSLEDAAQALAAAVGTSIAGWSRRFARPGLLLSGGLDSSIVLAALTAARGEPPVALHHHIPALAPAIDRLPGGVAVRPGLAAVAAPSDELAFAKCAAAAFGAELVVHQRRIAAIDLGGIDAAPLAAAPTALVYRVDADAAEQRFAAENGIDALFTGRAGDQVLFASTTPLTAADHVRRAGLAPGWRRAVEEAARRSGLPAVRVALASLAWGLLPRRPPPVPQLPGDQNFLAAAARPLVLRPRKLPRRLPPAKALQVADILAVHGYGEGAGAGGPPIANPLFAQPVVEAALAIPTDMLAAGGVGRGLARRAFAGRLPPSIVQRQGKAGGAGFVHRLVGANVTYLRDRLLGGALAAAGLLDTSRLAARLVEGQAFGEVEPVRLLDLLAVEGWLRQWQAHDASLD